MSAEVRSVQRALMVLRTMNDRPGWSLQDLHTQTGLAKSTLHRLLATLAQEGYVHGEGHAPGQYRLTLAVQRLSNGITDKTRLIEVATPVMIAATRAIRWPLSLGVIDSDKIKVVFCTMPYSPYAIRPSSEGRRYDLTHSALGKAYLSFCGRDERRILVEATNTRRASEHEQALDLRALRATVQQTRCRGYAIRHGASNAESSAVAVPVFAGSELRGVMVYSTFAGMMTPRMLARFLPIVQRTAAQIGAAVGAAAD